MATSLREREEDLETVRVRIICTHIQSVPRWGRVWYINCVVSTYLSAEGATIGEYHQREGASVSGAPCGRGGTKTQVQTSSSSSH